MTAVKAGGLCCERLGNCSLRCSRQLLLHCSTFARPWARPSCIHAVVKGAMENREPPEGGTHHSFPLKWGRSGWGATYPRAHRHRRCTPTLTLPWKGEGTCSTAGTVETVLGPPRGPGGVFVGLRNLA